MQSSRQFIIIYMHTGSWDGSIFLELQVAGKERSIDNICCFIIIIINIILKQKHVDYAFIKCLLLVIYGSFSAIADKTQ